MHATYVPVALPSKMIMDVFRLPCSALAHLRRDMNAMLPLDNISRQMIIYSRDSLLET